jgi:hypothetical protein
MGQRLSTNDATEKDAQIMLSKEECALGMGQRPNDAAVRDAQIMLEKEGCALDMVQISKSICRSERCTTMCIRHGAKVEDCA